MTRHPVGDRQPRYAIHPAIRALDIDRQDDHSIIEPTAKPSDKIPESSASSKTTESEQAENTEQATGRETDTGEHPFIQPEADEPVRMIRDAHQTGVFSGKKQS